MWPRGGYLWIRDSEIPRRLAAWSFICDIIKIINQMTLNLDTIIEILVTLVAVGVSWGTLNGAVKYIQKTLDTEVKPDLKDVRERFIVVEERVSTLWKDRVAPQGSPRQLNELGGKILEGSGIKELVQDRKDMLLSLVKERQPKTAYDADVLITEVMMNLPTHCPDMVDKLKAGAFKVGADVDAVLFVGAIYLRDLVFPNLGFKVDDLR